MTPKQILTQRASDIDEMIKELMVYSDEHGLEFSLSNIPGSAEYLSQKVIEQQVNDEYLESYYLSDKGMWLTSSDRC